MLHFLFCSILSFGCTSNCCSFVYGFTAVCIWCFFMALWMGSVIPGDIWESDHVREFCVLQVFFLFLLFVFFLYCLMFLFVYCSYSFRGHIRCWYSICKLVVPDLEFSWQQCTGRSRTGLAKVGIWWPCSYRRVQLGKVYQGSSWILSTSRGAIPQFMVKQVVSLLGPFWIERLQDLVGLFFMQAHASSSSSLLRSLAVQTTVWRRVVRSSLKHHMAGICDLIPWTICLQLRYCELCSKPRGC